jgi:hypothetical protein
MAGIAGPLHYLDAVELAQRIRGRELTSTAVVQGLLDRITARRAWARHI